MTIDEAIKILRQRANDFRPGSDPDEREATKLGIEALKAHLKARTPPYSAIDFYLPGETK